MKAKFLVIALTLFGLVACGGGSGSGGDGGPNNPDPVEPDTFAVTLTGLDIRRISNSDELEVDVSGVASGEVKLAE